MVSGVSLTLALHSTWEGMRSREERLLLQHRTPCCLARRALESRKERGAELRSHSRFHESMRCVLLPSSRRVALFARIPFLGCARGDREEEKGGMPPRVADLIQSLSLSCTRAPAPATVGAQLKGKGCCADCSSSDSNRSERRSEAGAQPLPHVSPSRLSPFLSRLPVPAKEENSNKCHSQ